MIQLDAIRRQFGPRILFEGLSWLIPAGARLGLVGPNGAGKTTLLEILCGRQPADAGAVRHAGDLRIAYLPQEIETIEAGSVIDVVLAGCHGLAELEAELDELESRLAGLSAEDPEASALTRRYGELRHRFEHVGGDRVEARARAILSGLGVPAASWREPIEQLSGGWRMRVVLARLLLSAPDLLLLDEPTNHLDLEAIAWLEGFLAGFSGAFVAVSHDRYFLERVVRAIVELEAGRLTTYPGGYEAYHAAKGARAAAQEKAAREQASELERVQRFVERFRYKASKARQVQSRLRALEKVERVETARSARRIHFGFPPVPRSGDVVVRAEGLVQRFGEHTVYAGLDLLLRRGERLALVGPNGAGKSTLLKLLAGRLDPTAGRLELGHNVSLHYYAQHQLEALDPGSTVLGEAERATLPGDRPRVRGLLGCFLFSGSDVDKPVSVLSGGEKARLALTKLLLRPANLLLLDEPTNHLDLASREVLEEALNDYAGTLVLVSHDRYFINRVATSIGEVGSGRLERYVGDYDVWLEQLRAREAAAPPPVAATPSSASVQRR
ncbi:MAG TPA: ABC-F family ATP-binding cassette domain-containing protein, partial [Candidatus Polarisedimenticolaceae bacterium]|nr:ABC-F family ATP-binding cassette domain-containing protein [Candidatus Polarisedimenticolaceae bacterium]